jgi:hypothetical protein
MELRYDRKILEIEELVSIREQRILEIERADFLDLNQKNRKKEIIQKRLEEFYNELNELNELQKPINVTLVI